VGAQLSFSRQTNSGELNSPGREASPVDVTEVIGAQGGDMAMECRPVFIAGIERSGTSLIYALLASHPNLAMTRRTNLWAFFYKRYGDLGQPGNLDRCLAAMKRYKRLHTLQLDFDRLRADFQRGEPAYPHLFALLEEQQAERAGKPRWGDKSLNTERYVDDIFAAYPQARLIHMIRDPRDRYASSVTRWKKVRGKIGAGTAIWLSSVALAESNQRRYPDRYMILRYESLASRPEDTLREICAFIGEEYTPAMLSMSGATKFRDNGNSSYGKSDPGRISTGSIGRYHKVLSPREIAFMQAHAGRRMVALGYELDRLSFSPGDRWRLYAVDWPINLARMLFWRTRHTLENRLGRDMPDHTLADETETEQSVTT
jgi:hypothetical protein